ncbi:hypothetical protein Ciccas_005201 [Cichlidogyrus casuarinus]|uniref:Uncharacterized protein n=1 Tax=Cichlidogyrus casuarinus TaxID=1844966 RepID=A0ABD2QA86_9PLAT
MLKMELTADFVDAVKEVAELFELPDLIRNLDDFQSLPVKDNKVTGKKLLLIGGPSTKDCQSLDLHQGDWTKGKVITNTCWCLQHDQGQPNMCWKELPNMPVAMKDFPMAALDGKIYAVRNDGLVDRYDTIANEWKTLETSMENSGTCATASSTKIYILDGKNQRVELPMLNHEHLNGSMVFCDNKLYVAGGETANGVSNVVEVYDVQTDEWKEINAMAFASQKCASVLL